LVRQYFPKGKSLAPFTRADLDEVAARLPTGDSTNPGLEDTITGA
jgi:hypothetical protein